MSDRSTFEEAFSSVLLHSKLHAIQEEKSHPSYWNESLEEDIIAVHNLIDTLCSDLSFVINRKICRISNFMIPTHRYDSDEISFGESYYNFTNRYPFYVRYILRNISGVHKIALCRWQNGNMCFHYWNTFYMDFDLISLKNPIIYEIGSSLPDDEILERLNVTQLNLKPAMVIDRKGNKALIVRLGSHWNDIVIGYWDGKRSLKLENIATAIFLAFIPLSIPVFIAAYTLITGGSVLRIIAGSLMVAINVVCEVIGIACLRNLIVNRYRSMKI